MEPFFSTMNKRRTARSTVALVAIAAAACARTARADETSLHVSAGVAHAVDGAQQTEFGSGGGGAVAGELRVAKKLGLELELSGLGLAAGRAANPLVEAKSTGLGLGAMVGVRVHPFASDGVGGLFADVHGGVAYTGNVVRPAFDAQVGYDVRVADSGVGVGPVIGFTEIAETSTSPVPDAARILWVGANVTFGSKAPAKVVVAPPETAHTEDRCADPTALGCTLSDRDHDGVPDSDDACPTAAGIRTADATTNGCPRPDRDNDLVFDEEDACPDVPGLRTDSPQTNGCPPPRKQTEAERVMTSLEDVIYFDFDSPRVRLHSESIVKDVAAYIGSHSDIVEIDIEGHADEQGTEFYNMDLSRERAVAVRELLMRYGVAPSRLATRAYGESRPRVPGHDEESHRQNRRVEFVVVSASTSASATADDRDTHQSALNMGDE